VRTFELALALVFAALGVRSVVYWLRRPFDSADPVDHALFAMYVTGRAGLWFAMAGMFLLFATAATTDPVTGRTIPAEGRAFVDAVQEYRWYLLVPLLLAAMQFLGGWFLGRRTPRAGPDRH
jgi:hypothetical protein